MSVTLRPSAGWRVVLALLCACAGAALLAWALPSRTSLAPLSWLAASAAGAATVAAAASLLRAVSGVLRWDGAQWLLVDAAGAERAGQLAVALDLGAWMLLRLDGLPAGAARGVRWIPVGRRALGGGDWHALRCAVYSPRPAPGGSSADAAPTPTE